MALSRHSAHSAYRFRADGLQIQIFAKSVPGQLVMVLRLPTRSRVSGNPLTRGHKENMRLSVCEHGHESARDLV